MAEKDLARLIEDMSNSLHRELQTTTTELRVELQESAERIESAVRRHSGMITAGTLAIGTLNRSVAKHDRDIAALKERLRAVERRLPRRNKGNSRH